jgi:hypothetical protein
MKERLNKKLEEIRTQKEKVRENFIALDGAEQVLLQMIAEVEAEEEAE